MMYELVYMPKPKVMHAMYLIKCLRKKESCFRSQLWPNWWTHALPLCSKWLSCYCYALKLFDGLFMRLAYEIMTCLYAFLFMYQTMIIKCLMKFPNDCIMDYWLWSWVQEVSCRVNFMLSSPRGICTQQI